jgi:hypothetical protein
MDRSIAPDRSPDPHVEAGDAKTLLELYLPGVKYPLQGLAKANRTQPPATPASAATQSPSLIEKLFSVIVA